MQKYTSFYVLKRVISQYLLVYKIRVALSILFMVGLAVCNAVYTKSFFPFVIDFVCGAKNGSNTLLIKVLFIAAFLSLSKSSLEAAIKLIVQNIGYDILFDLKRELYEHIVNNINKLNISTPKLLSRFSNDILMLRGLVCDFLFGFARNAMNIFTFTYVMIKIDIKVFFASTMVSMIAVGIIVILSNKMKFISLKTQEELSNMQNKLNHIFENIKDHSTDKAESSSLLGKTLSLYKKNVTISSLIIFIFEFFSGIVFIIIILSFYSFSTIQNNPGKFTAFYLAYTRQWQVLKSFLMLNSNLQEGISATERLFLFCDDNKK